MKQKLIGSELPLVERLRKMQGMGDYQLAALMDGVGPKAADEIERLCGEVRVLRGSHDWLSREKERLERAIQRTLDENSHLADGDDCTLIHLKRALPTHNV